MRLRIAEVAFCLCLILTASACLGAAKWELIGIEGGLIYGVAVDPATPTTLYAATLAGAFRSTDGGAHWAKVFGLECAAIVVHPTDSSIVFLANWSREVYKSSDGGLTFALSNAGIPPVIATGRVFGQFAFQPGHPDTMYYAWPNGLFKSTDGGASWAASDSGGVNAQSVLSLAIDSSDAQVLYLALTKKGVFRSSDAGATWNAASSGLPAYNIPDFRLDAFAQDPSSPRNLFVVSNIDRHLYVSTNGGTSWTERAYANGLTSLRLPTGDGMTIYGGGTYGDEYQRFLFKSTDGGVTFVKMSGTSLAAYSSAAPLAIPTASPLTVYASLGEGLSKTTDGGTTWTPINVGLRAEEPGYPIAFSPHSPSTWYVQYEQGGIQVTTNGGQTMLPVSSNLIYAGFGVVAVDPTNPSILLAAGSTLESWSEENAYPFIVRSTNAGASWNAVHDPLFPYWIPSFQPWGFVTVPTSPTTYFVMTAQDAVFKSTDGGVTFATASTGLQDVGGTTYNAIAGADNSGTTLYVGTSTSGLFKTADGGAHWLPVGTGLSSTNIHEVLVSPLAPQRVYVIDGSALHRSDNGGTSWKSILPSVPSGVLALAMDPATPTTIYAAGSLTAGTSRKNWIYRSADAGETWQPVTTEGLDVIKVLRLAVDRANPNRLILGGRGGLSALTWPVSDCVQSITPVQANVSSAASSGSVTVTAPVGCSWTASAPTESFVSVTSGATGSGAGTVTYAVAQNATAQGRTANLTIGGRSFELTQNANGIATFAMTATASPTQAAVNWGAVSGATSYEVRRSDHGGAFNLVTPTALLSHNDTTIAAGTGYLYRVHALDSGHNVIAYSNVDLAVPFAYTEASIVAGSTKIKAMHFAELRSMANAARAAAGLPAVAFAASTSSLRAHLVDIRAAINTARAAIRLPPIAYTDATVTAGVTKVKAAHILEVRAAVQ
jgi:hypothetical protein